MPTINAFKVVVHEKKIFKGFCYINLYTNIPPKGMAIYDPKEFIRTNFNLLVLKMLHVSMY